MLSFGLDRNNQWGQFDTLLRDLPAVRPTTAKYLTRLAYLTDYGIYDCGQPNAHPLAAYMVHPKEDTFEGSTEMTHLRRFFVYRYGERFNLSINAYFALPYYQAEFLFELSKVDSGDEEGSQRELKRWMDKLGADK